MYNLKMEELTNDAYVQCFRITSASITEEQVWLQRFQQHLDDHILPLCVPADFSSSGTHSGSKTDMVQSAEHVLHLLNCHLAAQQDSSSSQPPPTLRVPVEFDILNTKFLMSRFETSFQSASPTETDCDDVTSDSLGSPTPVEVAGAQYGVLHKVPALLVGCLRPSSSVAGGLVLKDATGEVDCELGDQTLPGIDCADQVVLLLRWNLIHSSSSISKSYLEVQELIPVGYKSVSDSAVLATLAPLDNVYTVCSLKEHMRKKTLPRKVTLSVWGRVSAISEIYRSHFFMIKITDAEDDTNLQHDIVIENSSLFPLSRLIKIHNTYLFTNLKDKVVKGLTQEQVRVLASTKDTHITSYHQTPAEAADDDTASSPPRKRTKIDYGSSSEGRVEGKDDERLAVPSLQTKPLHSTLISYRGVISRCILPEAGLYELDGRVYLYLSRCECTNQGRGLRCGATIELHNVHLLKISAPQLKHVSGFCCCALSTVRVAQFSSLDSPFKAFISRNKLGSLAKRYTFIDAAWILDTYLSLVKNDISHGSRSRFSMLEEICKMADLSPLKQDMYSEFLSSPHCCKHMESIDLSERAMVSSLSYFLSDIRERVESGGFQWYGDHGDNNTPSTDGSSPPCVVYTVSSQWFFGTVSDSELLHKSILTGTLQNNETSGSMELVDNTGTIPIVCCIPPGPTVSPLPKSAQSAKSLLCGGFGAKIIVTSCSILVEKSIEGHVQPKVTNTLLYLYIKECRVIPAPHSKAIKPTKADFCTATASRSSTSEHCLYFVVLNKNAVVQPFPSLTASSHSSKLQPSSFSVHALVHTDVELLKRRTEDSPIGASFKSRSDTLKQPQHVAINFPLGYYSFITNGCLYSLSLSPQSGSPSQEGAAAGLKIPTLESLSTTGGGEPCIAVTSNMRVQFLNFPFSQKQPPLDVTEVISKVCLPKFTTVSDSVATSTTECSRSKHELVALRGVILKHSYRINHMAVTGPAVVALGTTTSPCRIIALSVRSLEHPDSLMVYCEYREGVPLPIGLLPGAVVTFNSILLKTSKSGNVYCTSSATSSITVNHLEGVLAQTKVPDANIITREMLNVPTTYLNALMDRLLRGCLSGRIVCIVGRFVSIQRLSVQYKCDGCQSTVIDGSCMRACLKRRPTLKEEARFIIEDGSGEGHVYINGGLLREALAVSAVEWGELCDIVGEIGQVVYSGRTTYDKLPTDDTTNRFSFIDKAKEKISQFATHPNFYRTVKLICQPFVSQAELRECVIGRKCLTLRQYNTLALPRLQLRGVALLDHMMNKGGHVILRECEQLLGLLS